MTTLSSFQSIDFQSRGFIADAVLEQHANRKFRLEKPQPIGSYQESARRYVSACLGLFDAVVNMEDVLDQHMSDIDDGVYEELHASFVAKAEVALEFSEDALKSADESRLDNDETRRLRDLVEHWNIELRDRDAFYDPHTLRAMSDKTDRALANDEFVDGGFGR